jgi:RimJ/RimL family protein N-acetyltransferase
LVSTNWSQYSETVNASGELRFAIRYYETNGGPVGADSNYWGIDDVQVYEPIPVPISTWWISGAFILIFMVVIRRKLF